MLRNLENACKSACVLFVAWFPVPILRSFHFSFSGHLRRAAGLVGTTVSFPFEPASNLTAAVSAVFRVSGECWFPGAPLKAEQLKLAPSVVRLHRNLGHPRTEDFVRALLQHGRMDPECVALARRLRCATCERTKRPLPPRPTSLKSFGSFNDKLCMDYLFLHDVKGVKHAGGYNVFIWMPSRDPNAVLEAFTNSWATWAGYPRTIKLDQDGAFEGSFQDTVGKVSELDYSPAEAHWQAGEVEAFNRAFRYTAEKLIDEKQLQGTDEMKMLGILVLWAQR